MLSALDHLLAYHGFEIVYPNMAKSRNMIILETDDLFP